MTLEGKRKLSLAIFVLFLFSILLFNYNSSGLEIEYNINGPAMGTTYKIVIKTVNDIDVDTISHQVNLILDDINSQMSTYHTDSEISSFNLNNIEKKLINFEISEHFFNVLQKSIYYNSISDGMFDITVHPLYELWGFQDNLLLNDEPTSMEIANTLRLVGANKIQVQDNRLSALQKGVSIDVSAIAKGYTVDVIADYLQNQGYFDFLVEIGGEIKVGSTSENSWSIGIQDPDISKIGQVGKVVTLFNNSIATSGSYSNFIEYFSSGLKRAHIINPKTGYPIEIKDGIISSATVVSSSCLEADALATTLMLLSKKDGLDMIESIDGAEAYIIYLEDGVLQTAQSNGFENYIFK